MVRSWADGGPDVSRETVRTGPDSGAQRVETAEYGREATVGLCLGLLRRSAVVQDGTLGPWYGPGLAVGLYWRGFPPPRAALTALLQ